MTTFITAFILLSVLIIILFLLISPIAASIKSFRKKKNISGSIISIVYIAAILFCADKTGFFTHTGCSGDTFTYLNNGTSSKGSYSDYYVDDPSVMIAEKELRYCVIPNQSDTGCKFRAKESGSCDIIVRQIDCADISRIDVYHITVSDDLKCSYTYQSSDLFLCNDDFRRTVSAKYYDGNTETVLNNDFTKRMIRIYGKCTECSPPDEDYPYIEIEDAVDWNEPPNTAVIRYYIIDDRTICRQTNYDGHKWYEYRLDNNCKASLADVFGF